MINSKKNILINSLRKNDLLQCPICGKSFCMDYNSLICINKHRFDIAKQGYITILKASKLNVDHHYSKELFVNRRQIINNGFFSLVENKVMEYVEQHCNLDNINYNVLDLGCGEGSICNRIIQKVGINKNIILLDYSKNAIKLCTDYINDCVIPIVGDISFLPIKDNTIDVILNFLSPITPKESIRVLKEDGIVIKVIPTRNYLKEFRDKINKDYTTDVEGNLLKSFDIISSDVINYTYSLENGDLKNIVEMTPLMSNFKSTTLCLDKITIELKVLVLKKKLIQNSSNNFIVQG